MELKACIHTIENLFYTRGIYKIVKSVTALRFRYTLHIEESRNLNYKNAWIESKPLGIKDEHSEDIVRIGVKIKMLIKYENNTPSNVFNRVHLAIKDSLD